MNDRCDLWSGYWSVDEIFVNNFCCQFSLCVLDIACKSTVFQLLTVLAGNVLSV